jgi:glucan phosphoethanolaminetransferase (alkaline phosphatase superfamily)
MLLIFLYSFLLHALLLIYAASSPHMISPRAISLLWGYDFLSIMFLATMLLSLIVTTLISFSLPRYRLRLGIFLALGAYFAAAFSQAMLYSKIGTYPNHTVLRNLLSAPGAFLAYSSSGVSQFDLFCLLMLALTLFFSFHRLSSASVSRGELKWVAPTIVVVAFLLHRTIELLPDARRASVLQHSTPQLNWLTPFWLKRTGTSHDVIPFLPTTASNSRNPITGSVPRHVVLIFAECLRADRFPHYGYKKITTPFLWQNRNEWTVFKSAYAHGPSTSESLPVVFNSNYLAGVGRGNAGAIRFWEDLRAHRISSAFLSAGAIEWDDLRQRLAFDHADTTLSASQMHMDSRGYLSRLKYDYAIDDSIVESSYLRTLEEQSGSPSSFAAIHLVGTHFPFKHNRAKTESTARNSYFSGLNIQQLASDYDDALTELDSVISRIVQRLRQIDVLEESIIILTSDHGESFGEHSLVLHGTSLFDEQVRVPLLMRIGSKLTVRPHLESQTDKITGLISLLPTIYDFFRIPPQELHQGRSLLSQESRKYEILLADYAVTLMGVVTTNEKFIFDLSSGNYLWFDLLEDPAELFNLAPLTRHDLPEFLHIATTRINSVPGPIGAALQKPPSPHSNN